eukprot:355892-Chlamydomonas_euryale.AAC.5
MRPCCSLKLRLSIPIHSPPLTSASASTCPAVLCQVVWEDEYPASWEPEEHLQPDLIKLFQQQNPQLFQQRVDAAADAGEREWPASDADWEAAARTAEDHVDTAQRGVSGAYRSQSEKIFVGPA